MSNSGQPVTMQEFNKAINQIINLLQIIIEKLNYDQSYTEEDDDDDEDLDSDEKEFKTKS